jgi:catechol 2,3-dioxygenase-like lactoylglutathione lyase family enzyme
MIDHVLLNVRDYETSRKFYEEALGPLGYRLVAELEGPGCILAADDGSMLGLRVGEPSAPVHVAFSSGDRKTVDSVHASGSEPEEATTARPESESRSTRTTTRRSSATRRATTSRPSVKRRSSHRPSHVVDIGRASLPVPAATGGFHIPAPSGTERAPAMTTSPLATARMQTIRWRLNPQRPKRSADGQR